MEDKWTIDKLDGSNWITWKFQLKHLLLAKGLWKYVDGSAVLVKGATVEKQTKYRSESQKAFSVIAMSVQLCVNIHIQLLWHFLVLCS